MLKYREDEGKLKVRTISSFSRIYIIYKNIFIIIISQWTIGKKLR